MIADLPSGSLLWTQGEVINATNGFSAENRINEGIFAEVYKGQRHNAVYIIKRLKEASTYPSSFSSFKFEGESFVNIS